jgi:hypothetical protein
VQAEGCHLGLNDPEAASGYRIHALKPQMAAGETNVGFTPDSSISRLAFARRGSSIRSTACSCATLAARRQISGRSCEDVPGAWRDDLQTRGSRSVDQGPRAFSVPLRPEPSGPRRARPFLPQSGERTGPAHAQHRAHRQHAFSQTAEPSAIQARALELIAQLPINM